MPRHSTLLAAACLIALTGCAAAPTSSSIIERDPVDGLIAQNAAAATQALRELSEASGNSRVVTKGAAAPVRQTTQSAPSAQAHPVRQEALQTAEERPPANSIASRRGSIAVEIDAPTPTVVIPTSSGVVASGGLLSSPPTGLEKLITVRWTGELEELLGRVALETGWKMGARTGLRVAPVIISISADNRSAFDVLRDIGAISGSSADILVSAPNKTFSIRYPQR